MARFTDVRGFLDCDYPDLDEIRKIVDSYKERRHEFVLDEETFELYVAGWLYQRRPINWVAHAFFGASMRQAGVDLLFSQVQQVADSLPEVEGVFFVESDEGEAQRWVVSESIVRAVPGRGF